MVGVLTISKRDVAERFLRSASGLVRYSQSVLRDASHEACDRLLS
jgi:hypothetical protein